jgi:hypothetical protein
VDTEADLLPSDDIEGGVVFKVRAGACLGRSLQLEAGDARLVGFELDLCARFFLDVVEVERVEDGAKG